MDDCHDLGEFDVFQDNDLLYRRVHHTHITNGKITAAHCPFTQWERGLSCDWSVMTTPEKMAKGLSQFISVISVGQCSEIGIEVRYCPLVDPNHPDYNLAHCLLFLPTHLSSKTQKARVRDAFVKAAVLRPVLSESKGQWYRRILRWLRSF